MSVLAHIQQLQSVDNTQMANQELQQIKQQEEVDSSAVQEGDLEAFTQNMLQAAQQAMEQVPPDVFSYASAELRDMVDSVHRNGVKIQSSLGRLTSLTAQEFVELQANIEAFNINTQLISKVVSSASKQIESLTRMQ